MKIPLCVLGCLFASAHAAFSEHEVILESRWQAIVIRTLLVPQEEFTPFKIEALFSRTLANEVSRHRLIKVEVFTDRKAAMGGNCKCSTDVDYRVWELLYQDYAKALPASAELLSINGNAIMRIRDNMGLIVEKVLQGKDPTALTVGDKRLTLLHSGISGPSPDQVVDVSKVHSSFFLITDQPFNSGLARSVMTDLQGQVPLPSMSVVIRSDPWFIRDETFPVVFPYLPRSRPPNQDEYESSHEAMCVVAYGSVTCRD